ncbi:MAG TPA: cytochrome P450 [Acidimicrobiales bacterium]|nr:cytochrome P450 [Acidimicrobiales bacterium]
MSGLFSNPHLWADMDAWHASVAELRRNHRSILVEDDGIVPYRVLLHHQDVFDVSRDSERFVNTQRAVLGPDKEWDEAVASGMPLPSSLVQLDGQKHRDHRKVTNDWFKPAAVGARQPRIDELARMFVDRMKELGGECDFAEDIAKPYTLRVIMDIYGVPEEDEPLMMELTQGIFGSADPEYIGDAADANARAMASIMQFIQYFNNITEDRRACPRDDLATVIANGEVNGCPMGDVERLWYYIIVATAGHDTTSYALAGGFQALMRDPSQLAALQADPSLVNNATDEIIRWTTPVRHFLRWATADCSVGGAELKAGEPVLLSYPSANRDEEVFADSMTFDIKRADADKLLSFGVGAHFCLGAQFARREIRTFLSTVLPELESIEPTGEAQWAESHFVSGVKHLPVRYRFR